MTDNRTTTGLDHRVCPVCGQDRSSPWMEKATLRLVRCGRCSMIYADPVDSDLASGAFYDRLSVPFYLSADKLGSDYAPVRFDRELRWFRAWCRRGAVLDVGCSSGGFLFQLRTRYPGDYTVAGTDVAGAALDHAESRGIEVIRESFLECDFGGRRFDAVTFWAVIEHLVEPGRFLSKASTILKPGGHCFILVPNINSLAARLLGAKYRYIMPDHVNYFAAGTLRNLAATEPELEVVRMGQSHFNPLVILRDFRGRGERVPEEERARLLKRTTAWKQNPLLRPVQWAYRCAEGSLRALGLADNLVMVLRKRMAPREGTRPTMGMRTLIL